MMDFSIKKIKMQSICVSQNGLIGLSVNRTKVPRVDGQLSLRRQSLCFSYCPQLIAVAGNSGKEEGTHVRIRNENKVECISSVEEQRRFDEEDVLDRIWKHASAVSQYGTSEITGTGFQLGMEADWKLLIRPDGSYREEVETSHMSYTCGYDGRKDSSAWEVDSSGCLHHLSLDDHEAALLVMWIRTGVWAHPFMRSKMEVSIMDIDDHENNTNNIVGSIPMAVKLENAVTLRVQLKGGCLYATVCVDILSWQPNSLLLHLCGDVEMWSFKDWKLWSNGKDNWSVNGSMYSLNSSCSVSPVSATNTEVSDRNRHHLAEEKIYSIEGNTNNDSRRTDLHSKMDLWHPSSLLHSSINGGQQSLSVASLEITDSSSHTNTVAKTLMESSEIVNLFGAAPKDLLFPADSCFIDGISSKVPAYWTTSGHLIVEMIINDMNAKPGWFILDTGASGFVIEKSAADSFGLEDFGELHVTGMSGKVQGQFRCANSIQIGPLKMKDAIFMEMSCSGLVTGAPGPVIGIIGEEVFRRSIIHMPERPRNVTVAEDEDDMNAAAAMAMSLNTDKKGNKPLRSRSSIFMYHPEDSTALDLVEEKIEMHDSGWVPITTLASLPHVEVELANESQSCRTLLMVDTGAGGLDIMLKESVSLELSLLDDKDKKSPDSPSKIVRGVGGHDAPSMKMRTAILEHVRIGDSFFIERTKCLVAPKGVGGGVELSHYSGGILCGGILSQYSLVIDMSRRRMAIIDPFK